MRHFVPCFFLKVLCLLGLLGYIEGCSFQSESENPGNGTQQQMKIEVVLQDVHRCSFMSPEIHVINIPKGTSIFDVELVEKKQKEEIVLGKGIWQNDGSGIIPEGALTGHYRGPCPQGNKKSEFFFTVAAKNENKKTLAVSLYSFVLE